MYWSGTMWTDAPTASAVRTMVPRLPGSRTRSSAIHSAPGTAAIPAVRSHFCPNTPTAICGLSRRVMAPSTFSLASSIVAPRARARAATCMRCGWAAADLA